MSAAFASLASAAEIEVNTYIEATRQLLPLLRSMGVAMKMAARELERNAARLEEAGREYSTLGGMLIGERAQKRGSGTIELIWIQRAHRFVAAMLSGVVRDGNELPKAAATAYAATLAPHHSWAVACAFRLGLRALPSTKDLMLQLGSGNHTEGCRRASTLMASIEKVCARVDVLLAAPR